MTKGELDTWRKRVPLFILVIGLTPWAIVSGRSIDEAKFLVPMLAVVLAFFYVGTNPGRSLWKKEMEAHVGRQIREALLDMIPSDLGVTQPEKEQLSQREIYRDLTGVFWEAVDNNALLRAQKEHFYSNGILYSTSIDVYILSAIFALAYAVQYSLTSNVAFAWIAVVCAAVSLGSKFIVMPSRRERHLELSAEQLDLLRREQGDFVANRFRQIISSWRSNAQ
jgi:hypothetical protein